MSNSIAYKFEKAICDFSMLKNKTSVLVAFSGGADSTLLLHYLSSIKNIKVYAAHINHMIREKEALRDENFCLDFCKKRGISIFSKKIDIPKIAYEKSLGIEETARNERYIFLNDIASEHNIDCIATAHNASDNAETVIFNLARGCGANGMCGIPPVRDNIIRPLIYCTKAEIIEECSNLGLDYVYDSTNANTDYTRNFIRHEILPLMKKLNPSFENTVTDTSILFRKDKVFFSKLTEDISLNIGRYALSKLEDPLLARVLLKELHAHDTFPESKHIQMAINNIRSTVPLIELSLPKGTLVCDRDKVFVCKKNILPPPFNEFVLVEGINYLPDGNALFLCKDREFFAKEINMLKNIYKLSIQASVDSDKIYGGLSVRSFMPSDKYRFGGMTRTVKKLFQAKKIPLSERKLLPVITFNNIVLWIPGFPVSDNFKACCDKNVYYLYFFSNNSLHTLLKG